MNRRNIFAATGIAGAATLAAFIKPAAAQGTGGATTLDRIIKEKVVRIACDTSSPPFGVMGSDGKPDGVEVATCKQLAKDLGVELDLVQVVATQRIPALLAGRADITLSSISITFDRAKTVAFCNPTGALSIVVFGPQKNAIANAAAMDGKRIGVTRATLEEAELPKIAPPGAKIVWFDDISATIQALLSGQVDGASMSEFAARSVMDRNAKAGIEVKFLVRRAFYAPIVRHADIELRQWVNTWAFLNKQNGVLAEIYKKYTGIDLPDMPVI
jgi:polar amino acid transport system substrate-binding protein